MMCVTTRNVVRKATVLIAIIPPATNFLPTAKAVSVLKDVIGVLEMQDVTTLHFMENSGLLIMARRIRDQLHVQTLKTFCQEIKMHA